MFNVLKAQICFIDFWRPGSVFIDPMIDTLILWIRVCMMRIVICGKDWFMVSMVWLVRIGVFLRMVLLILFFPCFVRTRHNESDSLLEYNYISANDKKCR